MPRPFVKKFTVGTGSIKETWDEINKFQDKVRQTYNNPRTFLTKTSKANEPNDGELNYDGSKVQVCLGKEYKTLAFAEDLAIPAWFLKRLKNFETLLKDAGIPESEWSYFGGI